MKLFRQLAAVCLGLFATGAFAQISGPTNITSTQCASASVAEGISSIAVQVTGTWTGTLQPQVSVAGQAAVNAQVTPSTSSTPQSTITASGVYVASVAGYTYFQVCGNTVGSGTAVVYLNASRAAARLGGGGSGSGNGVGAGANPIMAITLSPYCPAANTALCFQTSGDTQVVQNCTYSTANTNIVCAAGTFTAADVGKFIMGYPTCNPFVSQPSASGRLTNTHNTIQTFVDSTTVTTNAVSVSGSPAGTGCIIFGHSDDAGFDAVATAVNTLATTNQCPKVQFAAAQYLLTKVPAFMNGNQPPACLPTPGLAGGGALGNLFFSAGFEVEGRGPTNTILWLTTGFPETGGCANGVTGTSANHCFVVPLEGRFASFQISGGSGFAGSAVANGTSLLQVDVGSLDYFTCTGWADLASGTTHTGIDLTHWAQLQQVMVSGCGDTGIRASNSANSTGYRVTSENANGVTTTSANLYVQTTGQFTCYSCYFFGNQSASAQASIVQQGGAGNFLKLYSPVIYTEGGTNQFNYQCITSDNCNLYIIDGEFRNTGGTKSTGIFCDHICNVDLLRTHVIGVGTGPPINITAAGSVLINRGGNTFTGGAANVNSGFTLNLDSQGTVGITAAKAVLSGTWGSTAAWSALNGGNSFQGTITASGTGQGATPTITYTFPTALPVGVPYCQAQQVSGSPAGTFTTSSVSSTGATFTWSGTPVAANTYGIQVSCE